ncbi:MAG: hypothetical protein KDK44_05440, partial [Chlamydiia bacterium]|nr:hypothetical protein [Chlamydiia bacterium]
MVRIESNQRSWACKVCTPLTRITAVALVAMALSCGAMPLSRNFQSYTQSLAAIWLALGAYLLIEAIFAGVFDTKGGTSCSGSGLSGRSTDRGDGGSFDSRDSCDASQGAMPPQGPSASEFTRDQAGSKSRQSGAFCESHPFNEYGYPWNLDPAFSASEYSSDGLYGSTPPPPSDTEIPREEAGVY